MVILQIIVIWVCPLTKLISGSYSLPSYLTSPHWVSSKFKGLMEKNQGMKAYCQPAPIIFYLNVYTCFKVYIFWYKICFVLISIWMEYFFYSLTNNLSVSLDLKWVFCGQNGDFFFSFAFYFFLVNHLWFLFGAFIPLTFKTVFNRYALIDILLLVFWLVM